MSLFEDIHQAGLRALQAAGAINHNHTPTGQTVRGRAGNSAMAAIPHIHPAKIATPELVAPQAISKKAARGYTSSAAASQTTTHTWSEF